MSGESNDRRIRVADRSSEDRSRVDWSADYGVRLTDESLVRAGAAAIERLERLEADSRTASHRWRSQSQDRQTDQEQAADLSGMVQNMMSVMVKQMEANSEERQK